MSVTAMNFPYETTVVSQKQFEDHITLYNGYVTMTNTTDKQLATNPEYSSASATGGHYRGWKKTETYSIDGMVLHELYFENLGKINSAPGPKTLKLINKYFGSLEKWKEDFVACATSARGWCIFAYEQRTAACRNILLDSHDDGIIITAYPIIVLDMYEHAYFLDYGTDKAAYINNFIKNLPWDTIERRTEMLDFCNAD
ncbi:MAG: Fe-Mn family superoxide dismutase [Defluviitaleaceae bacterium]|nr:Fe-Mn family superoxide dismutase [Defluviitaleaceae bacterium]